MTPAEIALMAGRTGPIGIRFRLVQLWNPDGVGKWVLGECNRGTPAEALGTELAEVMAAAAMGFAQSMSPPDRYLLDPVIGVVPHFQTALQAKVIGRHRSQSNGLFLPDKG